MLKLRKIIKSVMFKNFVLCFIGVFSIEVIFKLLGGYDLISWITFRIFISSIIIGLLVGLITSFMSSKINKIVLLVSIFIFSLYAFFQLGFYNFLGVYASFNAASQLGAVTDYIFDFIKSIPLLYLTIFVPVITIIIHMIFFENKINIPKLSNFKTNFYKISITIMLIFVFNFIYEQTLHLKFMKGTNQTTNLEELFYSSTSPTTSVANFGIIGFLYTDVNNKLFDHEIKTEIINIEKDEKDEVISREFDDSKWIALTENETDEKYKMVNNYLLNNPISDTNEYTGIFEGKNVIFVMMESVNDIILYEQYYPNFAKLLENGHYYENNYSPRNSCPTMNNEFSGITSIYSIYNMCSSNEYKYNVYPESVFNLFSDQNYNVVSMHDYTEGYYYRETIHPNLGSHKYYGVQDLNIEYSSEYKDWASDYEFALSAMDIMFKDYNAKNENFSLWLTTVSAHQPYTQDNNESLMYADLFENLSVSDEMKNYMSKLKVTDDLFGVLLERLEKEGILEDTVIVAYGDHYPYGLDEDEMSEMLNRSFDDYEADKVPMVIYNLGLEKEVKKDYTTFMNITPTIANMFNLDYDPRLYFGTDLYSEEYESRAVYSDGSWKNELAYYDAPTGKITYFTSSEYTEEELFYINTKISNDIKISEIIIKTDYFNYLGENLEEEKILANNESEEINELSNSGITR